MHDDALERLLRTLEVRLTAFGICEVERGWRLVSSPMRSALLHYVLKGEGFLESGGVRTPLRPGDIILVPAGIKESLAGPGEVTNEAVAPDVCALRDDGLASFRACETRADLVVACAAVSATCGGYSLFDGLSEPLVETVEQSEFFQSAFGAMLQEFSRPGAGGVVLVEGLMKQCLVLMLRSHAERYGAASPLLARLLEPRLARAVTLMVSDPAASHNLDGLAAAAGMSRSSFCVRFTEAYGRTPFDFLQAIRLRTAARLLEAAELPVKRVAEAVGYSSRSHFSRAFRAAYGVEPSRFRERAGAAAVGQAAPPATDALG